MLSRHSKNVAAKRGKLNVFHCENNEKWII